MNVSSMLWFDRIDTRMNIKQTIKITLGEIGCAQRLKKLRLDLKKAYYKNDQELMTKHIDTLYLMKDDVRKENYSREFKREIISLIAKYSYSLDEYLSFTKELEYINDLPCLYYVNAMTRKACQFNQSGKFKSAILHAKKAKKALKKIMKIAVEYNPTSETLSDLAKCYFLMGDKNNFRRILKVLNSQKNESQVDKLVYLNLLKFQMLHENRPSESDELQDNHIEIEVSHFGRKKCGF